MKSFFLLFVLFSSSGLAARQNDTVFLKRVVKDTPYTIYHAIFIDTGMHFKKEITDFSFGHFDSATYFSELKRLPPFPAKKNLSNPFPHNWVELHQLKGKYYLYYPSDKGYLFRFQLTDSTTIDHTMEGPEPSWLKHITYLSAGHIIIERNNYWGGEKVDIRLVDPQKGMAVFTFGPDKFRKQSRRIWMVDAAKVRLFPIVVNYCETDKQGEFAFDETDFSFTAKPLSKGSKRRE
jgi:hypothetical protein